jgi:hypothetical protein
MARVICTTYSELTDRTTGVRFRPMVVDGLYVGVAEVEDADLLEKFEGREGFIVEGAEAELADADEPTTEPDIQPDIQPEPAPEAAPDIQPATEAAPEPEPEPASPAKGKGK